MTARDGRMNSEAQRRLAERARVVQTLAGELPSPCISVCQIVADSGLCSGCLRTLDEIIGWSRNDDSAKRQVWRAIELRAQPRLCAVLNISNSTGSSA